MNEDRGVGNPRPARASPFVDEVFCNTTKKSPYNSDRTKTDTGRWGA